MSPNVSEMIELARSYCTLIEEKGGRDPAWLQRLASLLPRLHAAVEALGIPAKAGDMSLNADLDERFELFTRLRRELGERDSYWMEYDVADDGQNMSGSLADDLTDIYCELKHGLRLIDGEPSRALNDWRSGYKVHWGQHLVDAERHLYSLRARDKLGA